MRVSPSAKQLSRRKHNCSSGRSTAHRRCFRERECGDLGLFSRKSSCVSVIRAIWRRNPISVNTVTVMEYDHPCPWIPALESKTSPSSIVTRETFWLLARIGRRFAVKDVMYSTVVVTSSSQTVLAQQVKLTAESARAPHR